MTRNQFTHRIAVGLIEPLHTGVYRLTGVPASWEQAVVAHARPPATERRHRTGARPSCGAWRGAGASGASTSELHEAVERLGKRGRRGTAVLRALLADRDPQAAPTESMLEDVLVRVLRRAGLPAPASTGSAQPVTGPSRGPRLSRFRIAIETDSRLFHSGRSDLQRDATRRNLLVALGWRPLAFTWADARARPTYIAATVARELRRAG